MQLYEVRPPSCWGWWWREAWGLWSYTPSEAVLSEYPYSCRSSALLFRNLRTLLSGSGTFDDVKVTENFVKD